MTLRDALIEVKVEHISLVGRRQNHQEGRRGAHQLIVQDQLISRGRRVFVADLHCSSGITGVECIDACGDCVLPDSSEG